MWRLPTVRSIHILLARAPEVFTSFNARGLLDRSDETIREGCDFLEVLLEVCERLAAVPVGLFGLVLALEAETPGIAVDDVSYQQLVGLPIKTAFDFEIEVDASVLLPGLLDDLESPEGGAAQLSDELGRNVGVAAGG